MPGELVQAGRGLRRNVAVAVIATATLAVGIGASTAAFTVAEAVFLRPLPDANADRLVVASGELPKRNAIDLPLSGPDFLDLRRAAMTPMLVGVGPTDPVTFAWVPVLFLIVATASWLPGRRAAGLDPAVALRAE
jgi:hypothetical protein